MSNSLASWRLQFFVPKWHTTEVIRSCRINLWIRDLHGIQRNQLLPSAALLVSGVEVHALVVEVDRALPPVLVEACLPVVPLPAGLIAVRELLVVLVRSAQVRCQHHLFVFLVSLHVDTFPLVFLRVSADS